MYLKIKYIATTKGVYREITSGYNCIDSINNKITRIRILEKSGKINVHLEKFMKAKKINYKVNRRLLYVYKN